MDIFYILLPLLLKNCVCLFVCVLFTVQDLNEKAEKHTDEDEVFQETEWVDITEGYNTRRQKKVNMTQ